MSRIEPVLVNQSRIPMPRKFLREWVAACERELGRELPSRRRVRLRGELTIVFLDLAPARRLNQDYRGRNYATDVLSFASPEGGLGDLVLCPHVLRRQAEEHDLSFRLELGYMVLHGLLHLLGFDHENGGAEEKRMYRLQDRVFERLRARRR